MPGGANTLSRKTQAELNHRKCRKKLCVLGDLIKFPRLTSALAGAWEVEGTVIGSSFSPPKKAAETHPNVGLGLTQEAVRAAHQPLLIQSQLRPLRLSRFAGDARGAQDGCHPDHQLPPFSGDRPGPHFQAADEGRSAGVRGWSPPEPADWLWGVQHTPDRSQPQAPYLGDTRTRTPCALEWWPGG